MGLINSIFGKRKPDMPNAPYFDGMTAYRPVFTSWNGQLYENELVRSAIDAKARHVSKLKVDFVGSAKPQLRRMLRIQPNPFMTWGQFLYRLYTIREMQNTAFIVPILDEYGEMNGYFPVLPSRCEIVEYNGIPWLRYTFVNGQRAAIEYARCGVMTKYQYTDDFFGEPNNALKSTMELMQIQNQGITEGIKNSATFRFMARIGNFTKPEDLARERKRFNNENLRDESGGILLFPNTYTDIKQMTSTPYAIDSAQMQLIQSNVFNYFGVNEALLQNSAVGDALDALYEGDIEPWSIQLHDVMAGMTWSARERIAGNDIIISANRMQYMSMANKISYAKELADRGVLMVDEIRDLFNLPPLPDGNGQHTPARGEYYYTDIGKDDSHADDSGTRVSDDGRDGGQGDT